MKKACDLRAVPRFFGAVLLTAGIGLALGSFVPRAEAAGSPNALPADPEAVVATYQTQIHPILATKCAACHTSTLDRPTHYYIPVVRWWTQPLIEDHIRRGRIQFDFTDGFPTERMGAAREFIARLRNSVRDNTMPPSEYLLVHFTHRLTESERKLILDWADAGITALNKVRTLREDEALDAPDIPEKIASAIVRACPTSDPKDPKARYACGEKLAQADILRERMREPFLWGHQGKAGDFDPEHFDSNRFNPLVYRKMYLSLFMFDGTYRIERLPERTVIHLPAHFRGQLDAGEYPYPFWHSEKKWDAYNYSTEVIFVYEEGKLKGGFRSASVDKSRPKVERTWDQKWTWFGGRGTDHGGSAMQPHVTLYSHLFSSKNPYVKDLDSAYRKMALALNTFKCMECHSPSNTAKMNMLEFFNYPNQALAGRNRIITVLEENSMPPIDGIQNPRDRQTLLELAREYKRAADEALAFEKEKLQDSLIGPIQGSVQASPRTTR